MIDPEYRIYPDFKDQGNSSYSVAGMLFLGESDEMAIRENVSKEKILGFFHFILEILSGNDDNNKNSYFDEQIEEIAEGKSISSFFSSLEREIDRLQRLLYDILIKLPLFPENSNIPEFEGFSNSILNNSILTLLSGLNESFLETKNLQMIYSSSKNGSSFNRLCNALHGYDAPAILLLKHKYKETNGEEKKAIIGAYVSGKWRDELGYFGDAQCTLFTLKPKLKVMYAFKGKGGKSFVYMNSKKIKGSKYKVGLGFGGENYVNWRLWLDDEMMTRSTVTAADKTYPIGELNWGYEEYLNIEFVEVWGLGNEETLEKREKYRGMENDRVRNARKVDKKAMLGDDFARENFLGKNFAHRDNMRLDMDIIKDTKDDDVHG